MPEKKTATIFVLNRDLENEQELELNWHDLTPSQVIGFETITGNDLKALNTFADPKKVVPQTVASPSGWIEDEREGAGAVVFGSDTCRVKRTGDERTRGRGKGMQPSGCGYSLPRSPKARDRGTGTRHPVMDRRTDARIQKLNALGRQ